ncbi:MAG TPA: hypothetical protein VGN94_04530 [Methylobacterium sp.]|jgi:hypothetical protein|nr:hypothetical protein [Methylobacterium sp.]
MTDDHAALRAHIRRILIENLPGNARPPRPRTGADRIASQDRLAQQDQFASQDGQAVRAHIRDVLGALPRHSGAPRWPDRRGR